MFWLLRTCYRGQYLKKVQRVNKFSKMVVDVPAGFVPSVSQNIQTSAMQEISVSQSLMKDTSTINEDGMKRKLSFQDDKCSNVLRLLWRANSFIIRGLQPKNGGKVVPFVVGNHQVGVLLPGVAYLLRQYPSVFVSTEEAIYLNPLLTSYSDRSEAMAQVLLDIRAAGVTEALRSWRNENFMVWGAYGEEPIMEVERAAVALLGIRSFGVHVLGFIRRPEDGSVKGIWLQKRADDKPTYPGMLDTMVGGGMGAGLTADQVLLKEAQEEASVPDYLVQRARPAGSVSFMMESDRGIHANTEHVYDLELPLDFRPENSDGEVQGFVLVPIEDIHSYMFSPNYKLSSIPVLVDFLIRHGLLGPSNVQDFPEVVEMLHAPLSLFFRRWPSFAPQFQSLPKPAMEKGIEIPNSSWCSPPHERLHSASSLSDVSLTSSSTCSSNTVMSSDMGGTEIPMS